MKVFQSAIIRAICSIIVGILLLRYGGETMKWLTIVIGLIFFATGLISCLVYYFTKKRAETTQPVYGPDGKELPRNIPTFPIVGIGSMILGGILVFMAPDFLKGMIIVLAAILVLGALNQLVILGRSSKYASVPFLYWVFPLATLVVSILVLFRTDHAESLLLTVIGWCMIFFGVVECINTLKIYQMRRSFEKAEEKNVDTGTKMQDDADIEEATIVDEE